MNATYKQKFGERFPLMEHQDRTLNEIYAIMEKCISKNQPVEVLYPGVEGAMY